MGMLKKESACQDQQKHTFPLCKSIGHSPVILKLKALLCNFLVHLADRLNAALINLNPCRDQLLAALEELLVRKDYAAKGPALAKDVPLEALLDGL